ncbi:hypothetical protein ACKWTF_010463 [Chironomus riparius]
MMNGNGNEWHFISIVCVMSTNNVFYCLPHVNCHFAIQHLSFFFSHEEFTPFCLLFVNKKCATTINRFRLFLEKCSCLYPFVTRCTDLNKSDLAIKLSCRTTSSSTSSL